MTHFSNRRINQFSEKYFSDMSCPGSEDAEGSNLKGNPSDLDNRRRLDSPWDQRVDNVTATGTTDCCAGATRFKFL